MSYIDSTYYTSTYYGKSAGTDFDRYAMRASDDVDMACLNLIVLADLDAAQLALLKKATCAQVEWYVNQGDLYNESEQAGAEQIGGYSRNVGLTQRKSPVALCPRAMAYLEQSGLMSRNAAILNYDPMVIFDE